jgi:hypothetical protein
MQAASWPALVTCLAVVRSILAHVPYELHTVRPLCIKLVYQLSYEVGGDANSFRTFM